MRCAFCTLLLLAACHDSHPKAADAPPMADAPPIADAPPTADAATDVPTDANAALPEVALIPVTANRDVDLLFMVDNSSSTLDKQANLRNAFPSFVTTLTALAGGLPNIHIGVVTSDLGTKGAEDAQPGPSIGNGAGACSGVGQAGDLQTNGASQITGNNYILDVANMDGTRTTDYTGTLADAFSAIASVGATGCGFEQSIEAVKQALYNNPANVGFVRPDASLAIIFVTDEDDCSMSHSALISTDTATLGPLASFRCTRFGITCDQGGTTTDEMNTVGVKDACHSNESDQYLTRIDDYVTYFKSLKTDPRTILIAALAGDPTPFSVELRAPPSGGSPVPALAHSCTYTDSSGATEVADPAVRVNQLVGAFERHQFASLCASDLSVPMADLARQIGTMVGVPCITQVIAQPAACQVFDERPNTAPVEIPECGGGMTPCYTLAADATACPGAQHLKVSVTRNTAPPPDTMVSVRCAL